MKQTMQEAITAYAEEVGRLESQLADAEAEIASLREMLKAAKKTGAVAGSELLEPGKEPDLYPNERHEILVDVLKGARRGLPDGSRRADVLDDLLAANPTTGEPEKRAKEIKVVLKGYRGLDEATKRKLRDLGITAKDQHRKHFMLRYYDDPRYFVTMTASGSDAGRGGKNLAADMIKKFF